MTWEQGTLFDFETVYRPERPLCSPHKTGPYTRRHRNQALAYPFIEANPACLQSLIVADVDMPGTFWEYEARGLPIPSWRIANLFTDHYHAVWALQAPVVLTDAARRPPINLLARIEAGLRRGLQADPGYGGRIMRNPLTEEGTATTWGINDEASADHCPAYTLKELAAALDAAGFLPKTAEKQALRESTVGRNVALFDCTRQWAYRAIKRYWDGPFDEWNETVLAYAHTRNHGIIADQWGTPLPQTEVKHLSRSIAKWVYRRFTPEQFTERQRQRGRRKGLAKRLRVQAELATLEI